MDKESNLNADPTPTADPRTPLRRESQSGSPSIDVLQAELEETREETIQTINELERRLSYDRIKGKVKDRVHEATIGRINKMAKHTGKASKRWGSTLWDTIKQNPLPTLMVGGGMTWLIASGASSDDDDPESRYDEDVERSEPYYVERRRMDGIDETGTYGMGFIDRRRVVTAEDENDRSFSGKTDQLKAKVASKTEEAKRKTAQAGDQVREKASRAGEQLKQKTMKMGSEAADYGRQAKRRVVKQGRNAKEGFSSFLESNPLAVAGIVLGAGAIVGAAIPTSRYEDEHLGPARDDALNSVREAGREQLHKVQAVAKEATEAAKTEAENQGLVDREMADRAEEKAKELARQGSAKVKSSVQSKKES